MDVCLDVCLILSFQIRYHLGCLLAVVCCLMFIVVCLVLYFHIEWSRCICDYHNSLQVVMVKKDIIIEYFIVIFCIFYLM